MMIMSYVFIVTYTHLTFNSDHVICVCLDSKYKQLHDKLIDSFTLALPMGSDNKPVKVDLKVSGDTIDMFCQY